MLQERNHDTEGAGSTLWHEEDCSTATYICVYCRHLRSSEGKVSGENEDSTHGLIRALVELKSASWIAWLYFVKYSLVSIF